MNQALFRRSRPRHWWLAVAALPVVMVAPFGAAATPLESSSDNSTVVALVQLDLHAVGGTGLSVAQEPAASSTLVQLAGMKPATVAHQDAVAAVAAAAGEDAELRPFHQLPYVTVEMHAHQWEALDAVPAVKAIHEPTRLFPMMDAALPIVGARPHPGEEPVTAGGSALTGDERTIVIIDTGIETNHDMFDGAHITEACFVTGDGCPDGNSEQFGAGAAAPIDGHGTHVAGSAAGRPAQAAVAGGTVNVAGVAPAANLVAINTFKDTGSGPPEAFVHDIVAAMDWVLAQIDEGALSNVDVVNLSLGSEPDGTCSDGPFTDAVARLADADVLTVAAAGNNANRTLMGLPACIDGVFSVAAANTSSPDELAAFSNVASTTDVAAPGTNILSASTEGPSSYLEAGGTSMAAPQVAGAAAALRSAYPNATVDALADALTETLPDAAPVVDLRDGGQRDDLPLLDLRAAVLADTLSDIAGPTGVAATGEPDSEGTASVTITWELATGSVSTHHAVMWPSGRSCTADPGVDTCTISGAAVDTPLHVWAVSRNDDGALSAATAAADGPLIVPAAATPPDTGSGGSGGGGGGAPPPPGNTPPPPGDNEDPPAQNEPVRTPDGQLPQLPAGVADATVNGTPAPIEERSSVHGLSLQHGATQVRIAGQQQDGLHAPVRAGTVRVPPAGQFHLNIDGFSPSTSIAAWLFSEPVQLRSPKVGPSGTTTAQIPLPAGIRSGTHTLQLAGQQTDGTTIVLNVGVEVADIDSRFSDVAAGGTHWLNIEQLADLGVAQGGTDGRFRPSTNVNRGQMASFLDRLLGLTDQDGAELSDIASSTHADAIRRVAAAGIATGYTDATFRPADPVTRGQLATFLGRAADLQPKLEGPATDVDSSTHAPMIHAVMDAGLAEGFADGTYQPQRPVTRAQMASFLARLADQIETS